MCAQFHIVPQVSPMSDFRLLSWNILHSLGSSRVNLFPYCRPIILDRAYRLPRIIKMINDAKPGIVCLQELDLDMVRVIDPGLQSLRRGVSLFNESLPSRDGCAVYYNPDRFSVIGSRSVRFCDVLDRHLPSLGDAARRDTQVSFSTTRALYNEVREKLNMAVFLHLRDRETAVELVVASSHLFWDPKYPDIKLIQSFLLAKEAEEFLSIPTIIGCDLNSLPGSGVHELLMRSGQVKSDHPHHPTQLRRISGIADICIERAYESVYEVVDEREPAYTNYTETFKGTIDYILIRGDIKPSTSGEIPGEDLVRIEGALPNSIYPSDHLPLAASFRMYSK
jgi:CCR4-NOT transcription complex subunit 6